MSMTRKMAILLALALATGTASAPTGIAMAAQPADKCAALVGLTSWSGVTITSAKQIPAAPPNTVRISPQFPGTIPVAMPAYCLAQGMIDPHTGEKGEKYGLEFQLALPEDWNGRFLFQGGGGMNGSLGAPLGAQGTGDRPALARGFAVVSTDGGHKGAVFDPSFMNDQRAGLDFYHRSVGRVTEVAQAIVAHFYGRGAHHSYIAGCSTGGREGMLATQRFSEMFDGALVGAPAMRAGQSRIGAAWATAAFNRAAPRDASGKPLAGQLFSAGDRKLLNDALLNSCDAIDGLKDGIINATTSCKFDPAVLACKGAKTGECLSEGQVTALKAAFAGPKDSLGRQVYPGFYWDTGLIGGGPLAFLPSDGPSPLGPPSLDLEANVDQMYWELNANPGDRLTDTYFWSKLNTFAAKGGKMLFFHGVSDPWFSAQDTIEYYGRVEKDNGPDIARLYLVPGMSHCSGGPALDRFDLLTPLVNWVEEKQAPALTVASGPAFPGRTRPLCPFPTHAQYDGKGKPEDAASFSCRE